MALWASRALKYLKYHHRTGRSSERFGGCAAKKSPFLPKRADQAKKATTTKSQKNVSSQLGTTVAWQLFQCKWEYTARLSSDAFGVSRLITAVIWISRTPMGDAGPLGSTQTTTTATAMRQRQGRRETNRAPLGKWNGRRVEGDGNFGAQ